MHPSLLGWYGILDESVWPICIAVVLGQHTKYRKNNENHNLKRKWARHVTVAVGNIGNFWLITKSRFYTNFGPKEVLFFILAPFLVIFQILAPNFSHFKFSRPKRYNLFFRVKRRAFCPLYVLSAFVLTCFIFHRMSQIFSSTGMLSKVRCLCGGGDRP